MLSIVKSMDLHGLDGYLIDVQVDVSSGLPCWEVVGLPDTSVKEAKERVKSAIKNTKIELKSRRIVINLAPANKRKEGSALDLPIAIGILIANEEIKNSNLEEIVFLGELALDGTIRKVNGILPMCIEAKKLGIKTIILPKENSKEAAIVKGIEVIGVRTLEEVVKYLNKEKQIEPVELDIDEIFNKSGKYKLDFSEVKGQENIKRALEVAAARWTQPALNWEPRLWQNNDGKKNTIYITRFKF